MSAGRACRCNGSLDKNSFWVRTGPFKTRFRSQLTRAKSLSGSRAVHTFNVHFANVDISFECSARAEMDDKATSFDLS